LNSRTFRTRAERESQKRFFQVDQNMFADREVAVPNILPIDRPKHFDCFTAARRALPTRFACFPTSFPALRAGGVLAHSRALPAAARGARRTVSSPRLAARFSDSLDLFAIVGFAAPPRPRGARSCAARICSPTRTICRAASARSGAGWKAEFPDIACDLNVTNFDRSFSRLFDGSAVSFSIWLESIILTLYFSSTEVPNDSIRDRPSAGDCTRHVLAARAAAWPPARASARLSDQKYSPTSSNWTETHKKFRTIKIN
jgi:hypothetical protein